MPREFSRAERLADHVQRELAEILSRHVGDPRLQRVTISEVRLSRDLSSAKVFVTAAAGTDAPALLRALRRAAGFLRRELARGVQARSVPRLNFVHDASLDDAARLVRLIDDAVATDRAAEEHDSSPDSTGRDHH